MPVPKLSVQAHRVSRGLAFAAVGALMVLALATTADIVLRYVFSSPIRGFVDIAALAGAVLLAACFPYALSSRSNIAIDALGKWLGPLATRWLDRFAAVISACFFGVMAWQYLRFAFGLKDEAQSIPVLRWPVWPWWLAVALFVVVTAVVAFMTSWSIEGDEA